METPRECGSCHDCCVYVKVEAFKKPAGVPCQHLNVLQPCGACGIYADRPSECKQFTCAWLDGFLVDELKPDASGITLEVGRIEWPRPIALLLGFENVAGSVDRQQDQLTASGVNGAVIMIVRKDGTGLEAFGEPADIEAVEQWTALCRQQGGVTHVYADGVVEKTEIERSDVL
jgi:Fe-S-cluster containining protein